MLESIISTIICDTYEKQFRSNPDTSLAMKITFSLPIDYDKEEGSRAIELMLMYKGYVGVFSREIFSVVPREGIDFEKDCLKQGYEYKDGFTEWKLLSCHDSCWRSDGVDRFIFTNSKRLSYIKTLFNWYTEEHLTEREQGEFRKLRN